MINLDFAFLKVSPVVRFDPPIGGFIKQRWSSFLLAKNAGRKKDLYGSPFCDLVITDANALVS